MSVNSNTEPRKTFFLAAISASASASSPLACPAGDDRNRRDTSYWETLKDKEEDTEVDYLLLLTRIDKFEAREFGKKVSSGRWVFPRGQAPS
jgi:hypothetical protein